VVMMSHDEWRRLIEARNARRKVKPDDKTA
jgi:hypothetical protein